MSGTHAELGSFQFKRTHLSCRKGSVWDVLKVNIDVAYINKIILCPSFPGPFNAPFL